MHAADQIVVSSGHFGASLILLTQRAGHVQSSIVPERWPTGSVFLLLGLLKICDKNAAYSVCSSA